MSDSVWAIAFERHFWSTLTGDSFFCSENFPVIVHDVSYFFPIFILYEEFGEIWYDVGAFHQSES